LLMTAVGDQVTYSFPYTILGHTGFTSILPHLLGVNTGTLDTNWGNFTVEYDLDTGSGYSGSFKIATTANLTSETISPSGFRIKMRIRCLTASATNSIRGLQFHTSTTITDQKNNLYPLETVTVDVSVYDATSGLPIQGAIIYLTAGAGGALTEGTPIIDKVLTNASGYAANTSFELTGASQPVIGRVRKSTSSPYYKNSRVSGNITSVGFSTSVFMISDE